MADSRGRFVAERKSFVVVHGQVGPEHDSVANAERGRRVGRRAVGVENSYEDAVFVLHVHAHARSGVGVFDVRVKEVHKLLGVVGIDPQTFFCVEPTL
jgi:hypothetical protein